MSDTKERAKKITAADALERAELAGDTSRSAIKLAQHAAETAHSAQRAAGWAIVIGIVAFATCCAFAQLLDALAEATLPKAP